MKNYLSIQSKRFELPLFFILAFVLTWGFWIPITLAKAGQMTFPVNETLAGALGAWGPSLAGILLTMAYSGRRGIMTLLRRFLMWRFSLLLYLAAVSLPVIISLLTTGVAILLGAKSPDFAHPLITQTTLLPPEVIQAGFLILLPTMLISSIFSSSLGEEIGWRGFALPHLQGRYLPLIASLILGFIWGLWHFPRVWMPGNEFDIAAFIWLVLGATLNTVIYTWIFNASDGSLIPGLILHTSQALSNQFLSKADAPAVEFMVTLTIVILVVWRGMKGRLIAQDDSKSSLKVENLPIG